MPCRGDLGGNILTLKACIYAGFFTRVQCTHMDKLLNTQYGNSGDYHADGRMTDTLMNAVYISLITPLGTWWADKSIGSLLHTITREKDLSRVSLLAEQYAQEALAHIIKDRRAKSINITADQPHDGTLVLNIDVTDARGQSAVFNHLVRVI